MENNKNICKICNKEFIPYRKRKNSSTCSVECRKIAQANYSIKWYNINKKELLSKKKENYKKDINKSRDEAREFYDKHNYSAERKEPLDKKIEEADEDTVNEFELTDDEKYWLYAKDVKSSLSEFLNELNNEISNLLAFETNKKICSNQIIDRLKLKHFGEGLLDDSINNGEVQI